MSGKSNQNGVYYLSYISEDKWRHQIWYLPNVSPIHKLED